MKRNVFWFRRDLRFMDNHGLFKALSESLKVLPVFIFDKHILEELPKDDARVTFIHNRLSQMKQELNDHGSDLVVMFGTPNEIWPKLIKKYKVGAVYANHDYEPYSKTRDLEVSDLLKSHDISFYTFKDHVIFEKKEVTTDAGGIYTVFTPYKRKWLGLFEEQYLSKRKKNKSFYPSEDLMNQFTSLKSCRMPSLKSMGFIRSTIPVSGMEVSQNVIIHYQERKEFPGLHDSTSRLGVHFRFGTLSIREKAFQSIRLSATYLSELVWRDFYAQILENYPHVVVGSFRSKYDRIPWRDSDKEFQQWCNGTTGYPMVDAGMRELNNTGYMHNRVRMVAASFLTKHLLIDWRKGESYFALKLLDFDLASNNGGWQWVAGSGTDAAPYFRVFNPTSQMDKFDKERVYIKKWIPEYGTSDYPEPIVDHKFARERCLTTYKAALNPT